MDQRKTAKRPFVSPQTVADELGLNVTTVRKALHRGEIPSVRIGHVFRISRDVIESWKARGQK